MAASSLYSSASPTGRETCTILLSSVQQIGAMNREGCPFSGKAAMPPWPLGGHFPHGSGMGPVGMGNGSEEGDALPEGTARPSLKGRSPVPVPPMRLSGHLELP